MESSPPPAFRIMAIIFLLALAVRLGGVILRTEYRPAPDQPIGGEAGAMAQHLLDGRGFASPFDDGQSPSTHLPPLLPLLIAGLLKIQRALHLADGAGILSGAGGGGAGTGGGGSSPGPFIFYCFLLTNLLASSLVPVVTLRLCRTARWPASVGMMSALAMCFCPEAIRSISLVWDEALTTLAVALLIWWIVYLLRDSAAAPPRDRSAIAVGFTSGLLTLLNPCFLPATVVGWTAALLTPAPRARLASAARQAALLILFALLAGLPWHLRNWLFLQPPAPVFVRGNYWLEIWTSIHPITFEITPTGQKIAHAIHPWWHTDPLIRDGHPLTEQQYFAWCRERSLAWIRANPGAYALHVLRQVNGFWLGIAEAQRWRKPWWTFFIPQGIPALLGLAGWWIARRLVARPLWTFFVTLLLVFPLPYYFAGASLRYRHPLDLVIYLGISFLAYGAYALYTVSRMGRPLRWPFHKT